ncbi:MAG: AsmA-like C-terminal domain-containing protein, partial [Nitrospira sp.]
NTLNGLVSFRVDQGHIEKGTIVPKILMILDIPNLLQGKIDLSKEGMPFDSFRGGLTIEQGIVTTNNLLIDSPVLKLSAAGSYDIPADQLNLAVVVSPFGSYTKLLQDIPLFGRLLAGERTGFTTAFFDVQGSLKNPQIINQPLKSVGAGLVGLGKLAFDVLKNTLTLPAELFSSEEEKPASPETLAPVITPAPPTSP